MDIFAISDQDYLLAVNTVRKQNNASLSNLQRKLGWGYNRAAAAFDRMQAEKVVSYLTPSGRREVYPEEMHDLWKQLQTAQNQALQGEAVILALEAVQTEIAVKSFRTMDADNENEVYAVDANELAAFIANMIEAALDAEADESTVIPEWGVIAPKLSLNYLFSTVPELGFKDQFQKETVLYHLNYAAAEVNESAKKFVEDDHAKQKEWAEAEGIPE